MAAPAAPHIYAMQTGGGNVRLAWKPVPGATDYNVYVGPAPEPTGLEAQIDETEAEEDGAFIWFSGVEIGHMYFRVTALNALAEESAYSNERSFYMNDSNVSVRDPLTDAANKARKIGV